MTPGPGIEPGTHWWEVSALTTAPSVLPMQCAQEKIICLVGDLHDAVILTTSLKKMVKKFKS